MPSTITLGIGAFDTSRATLTLSPKRARDGHAGVLVKTRDILKNALQQIDSSTPAVVLRCARHGGLGITRSLGRLGVPVYHVDIGPFVPAFVSRYSKGKFECDLEQAAPHQFVQFLDDVAARIGQPAVLIPTSDTLTEMVADHAESLAAWYLFPSPGADLIHSLCSKREMYFLAKKLGIPTAEVALPQCREDALDYAEVATFPVMFKGIVGTRLQARCGRRMFLVHNRRELLHSYDAHEDPSDPNIMLQEYIPAESDTTDWMFNGYFNAAGECLAGFTGKKLRQYPLGTGLTSLGVCMHNQAVEDATLRFMRAVRYRGILDIGFRYDPRDGQYKVLDVNPRVGATFRLFVGARGMDVIRAMYLDLTGQPVEPDAAPEGRKWMVEDCDLISSFGSLRQGELRLRDWIRSLAGIQETGIFAWDDPLPVVWTGIRDLRALFHQRAL